MFTVLVLFWWQHYRWMHHPPTGATRNIQWFPVQIQRSTINHFSRSFVPRVSELGNSLILWNHGTSSCLGLFISSWTANLKKMRLKCLQNHKQYDRSSKCIWRLSYFVQPRPPYFANRVKRLGIEPLICWTPMSHRHECFTCSHGYAVVLNNYKKRCLQKTLVLKSHATLLDCVGTSCLLYFYLSQWLVIWRQIRFSIWTCFVIQFIPHCIYPGLITGSH